MVKIDEFVDDKYLVMATRNGLIKKTALSAYKNVRKVGVIAIKLDDDDSLAWVRLTDGKSDILLATKNGRAINFNEAQIRIIGRNCRGVRAIKLKGDDKVIGMTVVKEDSLLLTVTEGGNGRKTQISQYSSHNRGGIGCINYKIDKNNDYVAAIEAVNEGDDVIIISDRGLIIRIDSAEIATSSRYSRGVKVMKINEDEKIISIAVADKLKIEEDVHDANQDKD